MAHDVFISYSTQDKPTADAVCALLESDGVRCWIAPRDVQAGISYAGAIIDAINGCRAMVLIFSNAANASPQIEREIERAANRRIPLLPFRIEDVAPEKGLEYFLSTPHWLDAFTPPLEKHIRELARQLHALLDVEPLPEAAAPAGALAPPGAAAPAKKRLTTGALVVIGVVVAGGALALGGGAAVWLGGRHPAPATATSAAPPAASAAASADSSAASSSAVISSAPSSSAAGAEAANAAAARASAERAVAARAAAGRAAAARLAAARAGALRPPLVHLVPPRMAGARPGGPRFGMTGPRPPFVARRFPPLRRPPPPGMRRRGGFA